MAAYFFGNKNIGFPRVVGGANLSFRFFTKSPCVFIDLEKAGMISIPRGSRKDKSDLNKFNVSFKEVLKKEENVIFYPNSGRSYSGFQSVKRGLFKRVLEEANNNTLLVPFNNSYDFVIEAHRFENSKSLKDVSSSRLGEFFRAVRRFDDYFMPFRNQYFKKDKDTFAYLNFGEPIKVKNSSVDELVSYTYNSFNDLTLVSCCELVSLGLSNLGKDSYSCLIKEVERLLAVTPERNMSCKLRFFLVIIILLFLL